MNNLTVNTNQGNVELKWDNNGRGIIDDDAITAFEWGHCHSFAYEMNDLTGWPIIGIGEGFFDPSPAHFVVYNPLIDDFVDIQGPGAMERNAQLIRRIVRHYAPNQFPTNYRPMKKAMAKPFVLTVLDEMKDLPKSTTHKNWKKWLHKPLVLDKPKEHVVL